MRKVKRFEYYQRILKGTNNLEFAVELAGLGREGWELCGFEYGSAWFKREIIADA